MCGVGMEENQRLSITMRLIDMAGACVAQASYQGRSRPPCILEDILTAPILALSGPGSWVPGLGQGPSRYLGAQFGMPY